MYGHRFGVDRKEINIARGGRTRGQDAAELEELVGDGLDDVDGDREPDARVGALARGVQDRGVHPDPAFFVGASEGGVGKAPYHTEGGKRSRMGVLRRRPKISERGLNRIFSSFDNRRPTPLVVVGSPQLLICDLRLVGSVSKNWEVLSALT